LSPKRAHYNHRTSIYTIHQHHQQTSHESKMLPFLLATLFLTTTTTFANPLTKRNIGGIRLCDQTNWAGNCWYGIVPLNDCIALNSLYVTSSSITALIVRQQRIVLLRLATYLYRVIKLTYTYLSTAKAKSSPSAPTTAQSVF
jgi:hypothetical protein